MKLIPDPKLFDYKSLIKNENLEYQYDHDLDTIDGGGKWYVDVTTNKDYSIDVRDSGRIFCYYLEKLVKIIEK